MRQRSTNGGRRRAPTTHRQSSQLVVGDVQGHQVSPGACGRRQCIRTEGWVGEEGRGSEGRRGREKRRGEEGKGREGGKERK